MRFEIKMMMDNGCVSSQGAAAHPDSEEQQQRLREAAEGLRMATNAAAQNAIKKKLVQRLEVRLVIWAGAGRTDAWRQREGCQVWMCQASVSLGYTESLVGQGLGVPGLLITLSSQHAAKQAAASATQTIAAAQHAASAPKASAGPQPLLVQSCKVSLQEVCGSGEG